MSRYYTIGSGERRGSEDHFRPEETACRCGCGLGADETDSEFHQFMEITRSINGGRPLVVRSWWRCEERNKAVGGVKDSAHLRGAAADIRARGGGERFEFMAAAVLAQLVRLECLTISQAEHMHEQLRESPDIGIGIARTFVHIDIDEKLPRPAAWSY